MHACMYVRMYCSSAAMYSKCSSITYWRHRTYTLGRVPRNIGSPVARTIPMDPRRQFHHQGSTGSCHSVDSGAHRLKREWIIFETSFV